MNYYNRHIGDYAKDTAHLSLAEDGAYNRMLDLYYGKEQPLPLDRNELYRRLRVRSRGERDAVDAVLFEFFEESPEGWRKGRCDEEIEKYQKKAEKNRVNGKGGGRPKKPKDNPEETQMVSKQNPNETLASSQEPETKEKSLSGRPDPGDRMNGLKPVAIFLLNFLNGKTGRHYEPVPANLDPIVARLREGSTADDVQAVIEKKCREWLTDERMAEYLRPKTLFNRTNFANYKGEIGATTQPQTRKVAL